MLRQPLPLDARIEARRPITPELLAVAAGQPLELAVTYSERWFAVAHTAVESNLVLVFDDLVIGEPCPLLLEAVHHVRTTRRAERLGHFADEEDRWYELHGDDDDDAWWEPPTITDRVLDAMADGQEFDRLIDGVVVPRAVARTLDLPLEEWLSLIDLDLTVRRLLVALAGGIRIAGAVVVDARSRGEIDEVSRWAA